MAPSEEILGGGARSSTKVLESGVWYQSSRSYHPHLEVDHDRIPLSPLLPVPLFDYYFTSISTC